MRTRDENRRPEREEDRPAPPRLRVDAGPAGGADPSAKWAVSLLASAEPTMERPGRQERVWLRLQAGRVRAPSRRRWAFGVAVLSSCGLLTSAAFAGWPGWLARALGTEPARIIDVTPPPLPPARRSPRATPAPTASPSAPTPAPALAPPAGDASPPRNRRPTRPASPADTGPLLEAMRALRVERNPARARALLTAYLGQHPRGDLAEEALVMLVEAAVAHHDADAQGLAARYFRLYPRGPFRGQVERTLAAYDKRP
jgi:hypothetical protein